MIDIIKRRFEFCIGILLFLTITFMLLLSKSVLADEAAVGKIAVDEKLDMDIYLAGHLIPHNEDEIYYVASPVTVSFKKSEDIPSEVKKKLDKYREIYGEELVGFYKDELLQKAEYLGDKNPIFENIEKKDISIDFSNEVSKRSLKFQAICSYKIYKTIGEGEKEILDTVDVRYCSENYQFILDTEKPVIIKEGGELKGQIITDTKTRFVITDETGLKEVRLIKNGKCIDSNNLISDKRIIEYDYEVGLSKEEEKVDEMKIEAVDIAGNMEEFIFSYEIDETSPKLSLSGVEKGKVYDKSASVKIKSIDNSGSSFLYYRCIYTDAELNETCLENATVEIASDEGFSREYTKEGIYDISLFSYDKSGNYSEEFFLSFGVDEGAPKLILENVENGMTYKSDVTLSAIVREMFFDNLKASISGTITNGKGTEAIAFSEYGIGSGNNNNIYSFSEDGSYHIYFSASDGNGNKADRECFFTIDKKAPEVRIRIGDSEDESGSMILKERPNIQIYAKDEMSEYEALVILYRYESEGGYKEVEDSRVVSVGKEAEFVMGVPFDGEYVLKGVFTDSVGNVSEKSISFTVDENPPVIGYLSDFNEKYLKYFTLPKKLSDYIKDTTKVKYKAYLNSKEISDCDITKDGKYIVQVVAEDEAGNTSEEMAAFIVDNTLPKVVVSGLNDSGEVNKDDAVKITLLDGEDYFRKAYVNGNQIDINDNKQIIVKANEYGDYDISVVAADYAGNEITEEIKMKCNLSSNPFTVKINKSDLETLTKPEVEIRENFFDRIDLVKFVIIVGVITMTAVILAVFTFVDTDENRG